MALLDNPAAGVGSGRKTVAAAATPEQLVSAATPCISVVVQAEYDNTNNVAVGGSNVLATAAAARGIVLDAGESVTLAVNDLSLVWVDAQTNGEGVGYVYLTP